jgi:hypothetical protein
MGYKAKSTFSFAGKPYNEGDSVNITDEDTAEKLKKQGFITEGEGKSAADVEADRQAEHDKKALENLDKKNEAARKEWERVQEKNKNAGLPEAPKMKVKDETQIPAKPAAETAKGKGKNK